MDEMNEFSELETRLRRELRHVDAPAGFAERVRQRVEAGPLTAPHKKMPLAMKVTAVRWRGFMSGLVAATMAAGVLVGVRVHEVRRAQLIQQQFDTAMRVTGATLAKTKEQLQHVGVQLGNE